MATIIQREAQGAPSGYDQGLLLEYKEAFLYPLPSGLLDWNELRIGLRVGMYPWTGDWRTGNVWPSNLVFKEANRTSSASAETKIGKLFFGLKNSNNYLMPGEAGDSRFIGLGQHTGDLGTSFECSFNAAFNPSRIVFFNSADTLFYTHTIIYTSGYYIPRQIVGNNQNGGYCFPSPIDSASSGRYCQMFTLRYRKIAETGLSFALWKNFTHDTTNPAGSNYQTTEQLRNFMNSINTADTNRYSAALNFFYSLPATEVGAPIPLPDAIFAYMSMTGHRLIIYDFIAEKIS